MLSLHNFKIIVWLWRLLALDILFPYFICNISARTKPIPTSPQVLPPILLPQQLVFAQQSVRTFSLQVLNLPRYRELRRYSYQQMDMIAINRTSIDNHFFAHRYISEQFSTPIPYISAQYSVPILCRPHQMILTIPNCMASAFIVFHTDRISSTA